MNTNKLNENYSNILKEKIPILNDKILHLIVKYCKSRQKKIVKDEITEELKKQLKINKPNVIFDPWLSNNNLTTNLNISKNKYIKEHMINANALIEAIINITLYLYQNDITVNSNLLLSNKRNRLIQEMSIAPGKMLGLFITENIYIDDYNLNAINKNQQLLCILRIIAVKLNNLNELYSFVHGDFHVNNIYVNIYNNNDIKIKFIDFGQSMINIPLENNKGCLLVSPIKIENNVNEPDLKHLIYNLDTIQKKHFSNTKNYNIYKNFVKILIDSIPNYNNFIEIIDQMINNNIKNEIIINYNDLK
jgi:hypothetical protein